MISYDYDESTGCISVITKTDSGNHREALAPGELDRAQQILPEHLYAEVRELWTPRVVNKWLDTEEDYFG